MFADTEIQQQDSAYLFDRSRISHRFVTSRHYDFRLSRIEVRTPVRHGSVRAVWSITSSAITDDGVMWYLDRKPVKRVQ